MALVRGKARLLPPPPTVSKTQTIEGFCLIGKRIEAAGWLMMCGTLFLPLFFLPQSSSSFTIMTEFTGQNNPFFFNWKILSKCHNVLMSFELNITGPSKLSRGETIRPQSAQSLLCVCDSKDQDNHANVVG